MGNKVWIPVAVAGVIVVVLAGIFVFATTEGETTPGSGPAPTTQLRRPYPDPSGTEPAPDNPYPPPVPSEQVDGKLLVPARTAGRNLYIPLQDNECTREQAWSRGEHADRVEVEIRFVLATTPSGMTTDANGDVATVASRSEKRTTHTR